MLKKKSYKRYIVTSALPYANGPLHIGHVAGAYLPADIYVRYLRLTAKDVVYICGSDEHGAAITLKAKREGIKPRAIVDRFHRINKKTFENFGISFDIYYRTSDKTHHQTSQNFFTVLNKKNAFVPKESKQYYDQEAKQFLADRYIVGTCPKCSHQSAYGDQCEKCGSSLSPTELINPKSTLTGNRPILKKTTHWYLAMDHHQNWLKIWIEEGILDGVQHHQPQEWRSHVIGQCKSWIAGGLQARAMTRDLDWGVQVPLKEAAGKVLYVWLDAPIGYISATKVWAQENGKHWQDYWQSQDTKLLHFIGKDNIVFHCIIFPILMKIHGDFVLPNNIPANQFLNLESNKLSTSRNWAVWLDDYMNDFPNKQDVLRYVLTSIAPENKDSEFTWKDFQARNNNELVAILGNFVNRIVVLTYDYFQGEVPVCGELLPCDERVFDRIRTTGEKVSNLIESYHFKEAQFEVMNLARFGNKYLADNEPWKLINDDREIVQTIIHICLQIGANLSILLEPFLPHTAEKMRYMLGVRSCSWSEIGKNNLLKPYDSLGKKALLFDKIDDITIELQLQKLEKAAAAAKPSKPIKPEITFEDFSKADIRTATILHAEKIPKTNKLLKITLDTGVDIRTVVSGIAAYYQPEAIIGKQVSLLANLKARKIKGINSQGMILMAEDKDSSLNFIEPSEKVSSGSMIK